MEWYNEWVNVARHLAEYTDHRVVTVLQGSRGRSPPRPSRGMVGAISRSSTYGGLIFEDVLLYF
jgi:hypothetical protein